jgi:hypothetical protein
VENCKKLFSSFFAAANHTEKTQNGARKFGNIRTPKFQAPKGEWRRSQEWWRKGLVYDKMMMVANGPTIMIDRLIGRRWRCASLGNVWSGGGGGGVQRRTNCGGRQRISRERLEEKESGDQSNGIGLERAGDEGLLYTQNRDLVASE